MYLKYLPEIPTPVDTITVSDIDAEQGMVVELTPTEDLVTKMTIAWRMSWAAQIDMPNQLDEYDTEKAIILPNNIAKYGTVEENDDFYIYNQPDIIFKCATFWLIRKSNTWKRIKFRTFLNKLNLETFDAVTLDFSTPYVSSAPVTAIVEKAGYNSAENCIDFECVVPVRAGEMTTYKFYWPSALTQEDVWPPPEDAANSGSSGIGFGATGELPIGDTSTIGGTVFVGGQNVVFAAMSDRGDPHPTDVGFTAQTVVDPTSYSGFSAGGRPMLNLSVSVRKQVAPPGLMQVTSPVTIDIRKTKITDSNNPRSRPAYLDSVFLWHNRWR